MSTRSRARRGGIAAAAALLLILLGAAWLLLRAPGRALPPSIRPITPPEVPAERPLILAWEGGGAPFAVVLALPTGDEVWRSERVPRPWVEIPAPVRGRLGAGRYRWRVEGVDGAGRRFASEWFALQVAGPPEPAVPARLVVAAARHPQRRM